MKIWAKITQSEKLKKLKNFMFFICAKPNVKNIVVQIFDKAFLILVKF